MGSENILPNEYFKYDMIILAMYIAYTIYIEIEVSTDSSIMGSSFSTNMIMALICGISLGL